MFQAHSHIFTHTHICVQWRLSIGGLETVLQQNENWGGVIFRKIMNSFHHHRHLIIILLANARRQSHPLDLV